MSTFGRFKNIIWCHTLRAPFASVGDLISLKLPEKVHFLKWVLAKMTNFDRFHSKLAESLTQKWSFLNNFKQKWQILSENFKNRWWHTPLTNTVRSVGDLISFKASRKRPFFEMSFGKNDQFRSISPGEQSLFLTK